MKERLNMRQFRRSSGVLGKRTAFAVWALLAGIYGAHPATLPAPDQSGIEHIVLVMMENRSFDHFIGWAPGADGKQSGLSFPDKSGALQSTHPLAPDYQGCDHPDPDHSYQGGRIEYDNGACDGWLKAGSNDSYCIGYYVQSDLPFFAQAIPAWTLCDRYFPSIMASTFANRIYQHAAQTDRLDDSLSLTHLPTIWDKLAAAGLQGRYYFSDLPFLALWGAKYLGISRPISAFYTDCAAGTLPAVSYVDPKFFSETLGTSTDDHPHADVRNGEVFLNKIYNAVRNSPNWKSTVLVINYDEWGGFFDHVPPTTGPIPTADQQAGNADGRRGFRVPCVVISPWSLRGNVAHAEYEHTSILKMIEWRWNLQPLTVRDAAAANLAEVLDFSTQNLATTGFNLPPGPFGAPCPVDLSILFQTLAPQHEGPPQVQLKFHPGKTLEAADEADGPWKAVADATPPYTIDAGARHKYFRLQNEWAALSKLAGDSGFDLSQSE